MDDVSNPRCSPRGGWSTNAQHVELKELLPRLAEAVVEEVEASSKEWGDGEEMGTRQIDGSLCVNRSLCGEVVLGRAMTKHQESKENEESQDHLGLEARHKKGVGSGL